MGIGGHCPFHGSGFNHDLNQQCPPYNISWALVGIAHFMARGSIMILISNAHPTIYLPIPDSRFPIPDYDSTTTASDG